jgi:farnesyl-diphosphate farnesyltransferase
MITAMDKNEQFCIDILPKVSRTFAPTIRRLPRALCLPVTVAYLLCRVADTIEDSGVLDIEQKKDVLRAYALLLKKEQFRTALDAFMKRVRALPHQGADYELVHNFPLIIAVYARFPKNVRKGIGTWVCEMISGMRKYAQSKYDSTEHFLNTLDDMDEYIYYVAGTVGNMLTALFSHYSPHIDRSIAKKLQKNSEAFGKGLQMINIIRDMPADWRLHRSYVPNELLTKYALTRGSIFSPHTVERSRQMVDELIHLALSYLDGAMHYIVDIPKADVRIRLACLLPLFWALQTLLHLKRNLNAFFHREKIKISRTVIREEFFFAYLAVLSNRLIKRHYRSLRAAIERA